MLNRGYQRRWLYEAHPQTQSFLYRREPGRSITSRCIMVLWLAVANGHYRLRSRYYELGDGSMSRMFQRESFKALENLLGNATQLLPLIGVKDVFMTNLADEGEMWHVHVNNDTFEALTSQTSQQVYLSDNEADGPIVKRVSMQTANHIKLFTVYELKGADE